MGRKKKSNLKGKAAEPAFPSSFGSHKSMVDMSSEDKQTLWGTGLVICKDERGRYITKRFRLDSGIADPSRFAGRRYRKQKLDFYNRLASEYLKG